MKHTPPYYRANMTGNGQGLIIDEETGSNIAIVYDEDDTDEIVHAVNMHEKLIEALKEAVEVIESNGDKLPDLKHFYHILSQAERK